MVPLTQTYTYKEFKGSFIAKSGIIYLYDPQELVGTIVNNSIIEEDKEDFPGCRLNQRNPK
jgi:hypothetical protein